MNNTSTISNETSITVLGPMYPSSGHLEGYVYMNSTNAGYSSTGVASVNENVTVEGLVPGKAYNLFFRGVSCDGVKSPNSSVIQNVCTSEYLLMSIQQQKKTM